MRTKAFLLLICMGWLLQAEAQQEYFVFIQHEKKQPFYVRMGERTYSSSAIGHVILSRLKDSAYSFAIGFPNSQAAEQEYSIQVKKDRGFELKNLPEKGWSLFDLQSLELIAPVQRARTNNGGGVSFIKRNDDFARLMSGVVNDTAVMYLAAVEKKAAPVVTKKADTVANDVVSTTKKTDPPVVSPKDTVAVAKVETEKKEEKETTDKPVADKNTTDKNVADKNATDKAAVDKAAIDKSVAVKDQGEKTDTKKDQVTFEKVPTTRTTPEPVNDSVLNPPALPVITTIKKHASDTGYHMTVVDNKDSINIFIPADVKDAKDIAKADEQKPKVKEENLKTEEKKIIEEPKPVEQKTADKQNPEPKRDSTDSVREENKIVKQDKPVQENKQPVRENKTPEKNTADSVQAKTPVKENPQTTIPDTEKKKLVMINSDCRSFAGSSDVDKLRVKMLQEKDTDGRLSAARKIFKTKCFSAIQVKALSELFPYDDQKYQFLEAAYPFVSDTANFKELVTLLQDPTLVQRFRKMVRLD